jgi:hypothetical protein
VLLSTPLHASSNFTVSVQLANKRGLKQSLLGVLRATFTRITPKMEELKENIGRETANISAEQFQRINQNRFRLREECLRTEGLHFQHPL